MVETQMTAEQKSAPAGVVTIDDFLVVYPSILRQHVFSFLELSRDMAIDRLACFALPKTIPYAGFLFRCDSDPGRGYGALGRGRRMTPWLVFGRTPLRLDAQLQKDRNPMGVPHRRHPWLRSPRLHPQCCSDTYETASSPIQFSPYTSRLGQASSPRRRIGQGQLVRQARIWIKAHGSIGALCEIPGEDLRFIAALAGLRPHCSRAVRSR